MRPQGLFLVKRLEPTSSIFSTGNFKRSNIQANFPLNWVWLSIPALVTISVTKCSNLKLTMASFFKTFWGLISEEKSIAFNSHPFGFFSGCIDIGGVELRKFCLTVIAKLALNNHIGQIWTFRLDFVGLTPSTFKIKKTDLLPREFFGNFNPCQRSWLVDKDCEPWHDNWFWTCRMTSRTIEQPFSVLIASWYWRNSCSWSSRKH